MKTSSQIIMEYVTLLEDALNKAGGVIPHRQGQDAEFRLAKDRANYFSGYHSDILRDYSPSAENTIQMRWTDNPKGQVCNRCAQFEWSCRCYPVKCARADCGCGYDNY